VFSTTLNRALLVTLFFTLAPALYAAPPLFDAPWRGYDTGIFEIGSGFAPSAFAAGDLDGDGDQDLAVGDSFSNGLSGLSVLKNNGDGTYAAPVYYGNGFGENVGEVALNDFDSDGDLDVIATIPGGFDDQSKIEVWRNNGNGTFAAQIPFLTAQGPVGLVVIDVTGDGKADVVTANHGSASVSVLRHNGLTGASAGYLAPVNFTTPTVNRKVVAGDVNRDGKIDLAVGGQLPNLLDGRLTILFGDGLGNFGSAVSYDSAPVPGSGPTVSPSAIWTTTAISTSSAADCTAQARRTRVPSLYAATTAAGCTVPPR
jgi:hypothetical protein